MFENLDIFKMSYAMAKHAGQRQAVIAQNVANADTPGYSSRDLPDFQSSFQPNDASRTQRATRPAHLNGTMGAGQLPAALETHDPASPNGNNVSLEVEIMRGVEAKRQHDRALAIYKSGMNILRSTIGK